MFRKIRSNRDPSDTLVSELRKEFGTYFGAVGKVSKGVLEKRPRLTFLFMIFLLSASLIVSFTFFQHRDKPKQNTAKVKLNPMSDGFSAIMRASEKLRMTLQLKTVVDSLSSKKTLTAKDSLILDSALDKLQSIQKTIK